MTQAFAARNLRLGASQKYCRSHLNQAHETKANRELNHFSWDAALQRTPANINCAHIGLPVPTDHGVYEVSGPPERHNGRACDIDAQTDVAAGNPKVDVTIGARRDERRRVLRSAEASAVSAEQRVAQISDGVGDSRRVSGLHRHDIADELLDRGQQKAPPVRLRSKLSANGRTTGIEALA